MTLLSDIKLDLFKTKAAIPFYAYEVVCAGRKKNFTGSNPLYQAINFMGGPELEITQNNVNAYREIGGSAFNNGTMSGEWLRGYNYNGCKIYRYNINKKQTLIVQIYRFLMRLV